ncbi:MAG: flavodoxin, partial [Pseudomonadota bacterium]
MKSINQQLKAVADSLGKSAFDEYQTHQDALSYTERRQLYAKQANEEVIELQRKSKQSRIEKLLGASELNPNWTFDKLVEDSQDAKDAIDIARAFIAAHSDREWRNGKSHLMLFFGDYGRGKSHIAGAIAHQLIEQYEVTVLYRQLQSLLEMRFFSYDFSADDDAPEQFREISRQLLDVELLILDEVCVNETVLKPNAQSWLGN